ncbi:RNA-directed DNA polymerase, eukaryota, reverse transcriptase zinc-binding domain protein [Tanacetum coccineum]
MEFPWSRDHVRHLLEYSLSISSLIRRADTPYLLDGYNVLNVRSSLKRVRVKSVNVKNKKDIECLDLADRDTLVKDVSNNNVFDEVAEYQKKMNVDVMDNDGLDGKVEKCSGTGVTGDVGGIENNKKVQFSSVDAEMLERNKGSCKMNLPNECTMKEDNGKNVELNVDQSMEKKFTMPTKNENGVEVVVFDDVMVVEGSKKWDLTLCGYFIDKNEPQSIPLWVKLCNVPLKAWTNGISALASKIEKPLVMDSMTAIMCKQGIRKVSTPLKKADNVEDKKSKSATGQSSNTKKQWSVHKDILQAMKRSAKKFSLADMLKDKGSSKNAYEKDSSEDEDVLCEENGIIQCMEEDEISGMDGGSVLVRMETIDGDINTYGTFIYADNGGVDRKELWEDLVLYKRIIGKNHWFLKGDLKLWLLMRTQCEALTKNLHTTKNSNQTGILKKLDRIMGSEDFIGRFNQAYALFLPYLISDHCPTVLVIPKCMQVKKKVFKFANFIAGKEEFIPTITQKLGGTNEGCKMFKIVKNLRGLKRDLKRLSWKDGDVFENVSKLRYLLKDVQIRIDKDPHNK